MVATTKSRFKPWVGEEYESSKPRILVLGESHYGQGNESDVLTSIVVRGWAIDQKKAFFTKIAQAVTGNFRELTQDEKHEFWHSVAFYNYIQDVVGIGPRIPPGHHHWANAQEPFDEVMKVLRPDVVIVLGLRLVGAIKQIEQLHPEARFVYWYHPSGSKFKRVEMHKVLHETVSVS